MPNRGALGEALVEVRHIRRLSQEQLARMMGVSSGLIAQMETGRRDLTLDTLEALRGALEREGQELSTVEYTRLYDLRRKRAQVDSMREIRHRLDELEAA